MIQLPSLSGQTKSPGIQIDDTLAEAGCKVLRFHFARFLSFEKGTSQGKDIESLHQMRVAARRIRVALSLFGAFINPGKTKSIQKSLRRTGRVLGRVRDMDIFWKKAQHYFESLSETNRSGFELMQDQWSLQRAVTQGRVQVYLQRKKYHKFKKMLRKILELPHSSNLQQVSITQFASEVITTGYDQALSKQVILESPTVAELHTLRIAFKKFRYTIEFFTDILGEEVQQCIGSLKRIQDHLGDINDASVALDLLNNSFYSPQNPFHCYLQEKRQNELSEMIHTFPKCWEEFMIPLFFENLSSAISEMEAER